MTTYSIWHVVTEKVLIPKGAHFGDTKIYYYCLKYNIIVQSFG